MQTAHALGQRCWRFSRSASRHFNGSLGPLRRTREDTNIDSDAACVYSLLGETGEAIDLLRAMGDAVGAEMKTWFKH